MGTEPQAPPPPQQQANTQAPTLPRPTSTSGSNDSVIICCGEKKRIAHFPLLYTTPARTPRAEVGVALSISPAAGVRPGHCTESAAHVAHGAASRPGALLSSRFWLAKALGMTAHQEEGGGRCAQHQVSSRNL